MRPSIVAIYHFARTADDIADEGLDPPATRLAKLDHYGTMLDRLELGEDTGEAPFTALAKAIRRDALPLKPLRDLLSAFRQDVVKTRYRDYPELLDYCERSANPVGRLMLHLYGVRGEVELSRSDAVCTGLQLANFWQDVALDWDKGRVYLPLEDMQRYGVHEDDIAAKRCDVRWSALMRFQTERAYSLLESGRPLARALSIRTRLELRLVIAGGQRILRAVDAVEGDVFRRRPVIRRRDWAGMLLSAVAS